MVCPDLVLDEEKVMKSLTGKLGSGYFRLLTNCRISVSSYRYISGSKCREISLDL